MANPARLSRSPPQSSIQNCLAHHGGMPLRGAGCGSAPVWATTAETSYYSAGDAASLSAELDTVATAAFSCSYTVGEPVTDPNGGFVYVTQNNVRVRLPRDPTHADDWDYNAVSQSVTFYGSVCAGLRNGSIESPAVVFGYPGKAE